MIIQNTSKTKTFGLFMIIVVVVLVFISIVLYSINTEDNLGNDVDSVIYTDLGKIEIDKSKPVHLNYSRTCASVVVKSWENDYIKIDAEKRADNKLRAKVTQKKEVNQIILTDFGISPNMGYVVYTAQAWLPLFQFSEYKDSILTNEMNKRAYKCTIYVPAGLVDVVGNGITI